MTNPPIGRVGKNPQISQKTQMSRAPPKHLPSPRFPVLDFQFPISNFQFSIFNFQCPHSPIHRFLNRWTPFSPVGYIEVVT